MFVPISVVEIMKEYPFQCQMSVIFLAEMIHACGVNGICHENGKYLLQ